MKISFKRRRARGHRSSHLVEANAAESCSDCGLIQGGKERHERNREPLPFDTQAVDCVVLSHAHIDHSGRLPLLVKSGYGGPILATEPTVKLCEILLTDSARIQEEDARWTIKRLNKKGEDSSWVKPLYTEEDARAALERLVPVPFDTPTEAGPGRGQVRQGRSHSRCVDRRSRVAVERRDASVDVLGRSRCRRCAVGRRSAERTGTGLPADRIDLWRSHAPGGPGARPISSTR